MRESLILLAEEGLVQVFPQVGSFVSRVDPARVADAQFLREAVELAALDDLPADPDPELVAELRENIARQQRPGIDVEEFFGLDEEFHRGLLRLSSHGSAWSTVVSAKGHLDRARRLGLYEVGSPRFFADQHEEILRAVLDHDIERARRTMRGHLRAVFEDIEQLRSRSPSCSRPTRTRCRCGGTSSSGSEAAAPGAGPRRCRGRRRTLPAWTQP